MKAIILVLHAFRDLILRYLPRMREKGGFAFLVHPRNIPDVFRKYPFLKILPVPLLEWFLRHYWPVVLSGVGGIKTLDGEPVNGWIITIPLTAEQMMNDRALTLKKIIQACKLAEKLGATVMGLGALTSSLTKGGIDLIDKVKIGITTGRAYTAKTIIENLFSVSETLDINPEKATVAIVGAAGGIGSACAKILATKGVKNFILIDLDRKRDSMDDIIHEIKNDLKRTNVFLKASSQIHDIYPADIIIAATNAPEVIIGPEHLKPGAVVINDAQPSDISPEVFRKRDDVLVIEGGVINIPGIKYRFNFGLVARENIFCCMGEVVALASVKWDKDYAVGYLDLKLVDDIGKIAGKLNFQLAEFQNPIEGKISEIKINRVKNIIAKSR